MIISGKLLIVVCSRQRWCRWVQRWRWRGGGGGGGGGGDARAGRRGTSLPIIDLLKKKQLRLHGGPDGLAKYQTKKKKNKQHVDAYVDYRQVIPKSLLRLKEAALRAQANPEELDEYINVERQLEECIPDILLFMGMDRLWGW
jgi:hypothetical protein